MDSELSDSSDDISSIQRTSEKIVRMDREQDVLKKLRATTQELGPDCKCKRYYLYLKSIYLTWYFCETCTNSMGIFTNLPRKLSDEIHNKVVDFLKSLKGRKSHYSLKDSKRIYLPETLNIKKLHSMFENKNLEYKISYESFRKIFETKFNNGFGYPRKDTCSVYDSLKAEIATLTEKLKNATPTSGLSALLTSKKDYIKNIWKKVE